MANIFVKIDGTAGTGTGAHQGWLKALNFMFPKSQHHEATLTRVQDAASAKLFLLLSRGTIIPKVIVDAAKDGKTFFRMELSDVDILSMRTSPGLWLSTEEITLRFTEAKSISGISLAAASALTGGLAGGASRR